MLVEERWRDEESMAPGTARIRIRKESTTEKGQARALNHHGRNLRLPMALCRLFCVLAPWRPFTVPK